MHNLLHNREKELAKAAALQEKNLTRVRQHYPSAGPPDDEDIEMEKLVEVGLCALRRWGKLLGVV